MNVRYPTAARPLAALLATLACADAAVAADANPVVAPASLAAALTGGTPVFQFRTRYEDVEQDSAVEDAQAWTLKSRLGYTSAAYRGWQAMAEVDNTSAIGDEDYNSTSNGNTAYPVVADPEGTELNQAWVSYSGIGDTALKAGRQRILLDNERFVGGVGWRQNEQTYDGGSIVNKSLKDTSATYAYVYNVNRIFGPDDGTTEAWKGDWESAIHLLNLSYAGLPFGTLTVYDYLMDIEGADTQSNATMGLRFAGKQAMGKSVSLLYTLEYATQEDYGDNPVSYEADYHTAEAGLALPAAVTVSVGEEVLEGDAGAPGRAFRTPLATLHKFQGFADLFLTTPAAGIEDRYINASVVLLGITAAAAWHEFEAEDGDASYGEELDLTLSRKFGKYLTGLLKYADYQEDGFASDTRKFWVQVQVDI